MNSVNFSQLLCSNISESGTDIGGIFDTLICEPGENCFVICIFYSQTLSLEDPLIKYYYRIVLRYLGNNGSGQKHCRVDSGVFWDDENMSLQGAVNTKEAHYQATKRGNSGKLAIRFCTSFEREGNYEVDLYVKKMEESDSFESIDNLSVKQLNFVTLSPFSIHFKQKNN